MRMISIIYGIITTGQDWHFHPELCRVLGASVKDRATCLDEEPDRKRAKIDSYRFKK
jgi:hypothetical protein